MNKISNAFSSGKAFIPFITGGDPDLETTEKLLYALYESGASLIEIGIPFSDPIAEGPVIQAADERALKAGCTIEKLFDLVARVRPNIKVPLLFMTYYNPIFAYGVSKFTEKCSACGLDGLIVPDLPFEEREELLEPCVSRGLELISLIAPTSETRIANIAKNSGGFLYCVSSLGVTGVRRELGDSARRMVEQVKRITTIPCAVGFGVSTPEQAREIAGFADGVIIGSAIVRIVAEHGRDSVEPVREFAKKIKQAIS
ncbi:MAG: tryptophan synthase subunit alpha [Treponema sp.]|jgi:tryptophan synthase alpha chain|nr:tryptophan synthase subunit alpha [Treponema sp.]